MKKFLIALLVLAEIGMSAVEIHFNPAKPVRFGNAAMATADNGIPATSPSWLLRLHPDEVEIDIVVPHGKDVPYRETGKGDDDPQIFAGETVEIMLSPEPQSGIYYHLGVNPAGFAYTAKKRDISWGKNVKVTVEKREKNWSVIVRIPYAELGTTFPVSGKSWRFNVGATMLQVGGKMLSLNWNCATNYHDIREFGTIRFDDQDVTEIRFWRAEAGKVSAIAHLAPGEKELFCRVGEKVFSGKSLGQIAIFNFKLPENTATLRDRQKCRFVRADGSVVREAYAPDREAHRFVLDGFYYPPSWKVNFSHDAPAATIRILDQGKVVRELSPAPENGSLSLENLPVGDYVVEIASGTWRSCRLIKVVPENFAPPAIADDAVLSISNRLLKLDNVPVFLIGGSEFPKFPLPKYAAFNLGGARAGIQTNAVRFTSQPGIRRMITYPDAGRIVGDLLVGIRKSYLEHPDHKRSFARLSYEAQLPVRIKTADGKQYTLASQPLFAQLYTALKREYPDRLYSIHIDSLDLIPSFGPYCDILELTSWRCSFAVDLLRFLRQDMRSAREAAGKPVIFWLGGSLPSPDQRSAELLRAAVYEAMLARLSGVVFHMGHGGIPQSYGRLWSLLAGINAEIQPIYPDLAEGEEVPDFVKQFSGDFRWVARRRGGVTRLVVFNLSENEAYWKAETQKGMLSDRLTPLEVKVYTWRDLK